MTVITRPLVQNDAEAYRELRLEAVRVYPHAFGRIVK